MYDFDIAKFCQNCKKVRFREWPKDRVGLAEPFWKIGSADNNIAAMIPDIELPTSAYGKEKFSLYIWW